MFDDGLMRQKDDGSFQIVENPLERIVLKREAEKRKSEQMSQSQQQFDVNSEQSHQQEMIQSSLKDKPDEVIN